MRLGKLLKATFLRPFLQEALPLLGEAGLVAVFENTSPPSLLACVFSPAISPEDAQSLLAPGAAPPAGCEVLELRLEGQVMGALLVGKAGPGPAPTAANAFLRRTLEELLQRERLCRAVGRETLEAYREVALLQRCALGLNHSMKSRDVVTALLDECRKGGFPADYAVVFGEDETVRQTVSLRERNAAACPSGLGGIARSRLYLEIRARDRGDIANNIEADPRWAGEADGVASLLLMPIRSANMLLGVLALVSVAEPQAFAAADLKRASTLCSMAGVSMANAHHFEQVQRILLALIKSMSTAIDSRDHLTAGHSLRVAGYSVGLAICATSDAEITPHVLFTESDIQEIFYAGLLHDVGKIGVREEVLTKATRLPQTHIDFICMKLGLWGSLTGEAWTESAQRLQRLNRAYRATAEDEALIQRLTGQKLMHAGSVISLLSEDERDRLLTPRGNLTVTEWAEIKRHPDESFRILEGIPFQGYFPNILTIIRQHHERLDGTGYPAGAAGEDILLQSRILAIVDVFDSLRRDRHYKKALPEDKALAILDDEAARGKLDADLARLFRRDLREIERIAEERMNQLTAGELIH